MGDVLRGFSKLCFLLQEWCLLVRGGGKLQGYGSCRRDPACFLTRGITIGSSRCPSSGKCTFSFCLAEAFALYLCVFSLMLGWIAARQLIWIIFVIVLWQKATAHCKQSMFARYPHRPHPAHCVVALGFLPGEIPGIGCWRAQCHKHTVLSGPPQKWCTVGIFLLWNLITLANDTDVRRALNFLENRVKIQNLDNFEKPPGGNKRQFGKGHARSCTLSEKNRQPRYCVGDGSAEGGWSWWWPQGWHKSPGLCSCDKDKLRFISEECADILPPSTAWWGLTWGLEPVFLLAAFKNSKTTHTGQVCLFLKEKQI